MNKDFDKSALGELSDAILAGIIGTTMDGMITVDEQQRVMLFNAAAENMFGRTAAEMLAQPLERLIPERFRAAHCGHIQTFGKTNLTRRKMGGLNSIYGLRANGEEFPIEASISHTEIKGQKLYTVILRDITERMRVEETLRANTELIQSIVESSDDAIIGKTLDGIIISWNSGAEKLFGYSAQEALGKPMTILIPPERADEEPTILGRIGRGERVDHFETVRVRKDGRRIDISATISPLKDRSGKTIGASKIARDITERKEAAEAVRQSESRYHTLFDTLIEGFCTIEVIFDSSEKAVDFRYLEINPAFEKQSGLHDAKGRLIRDLAPNLEEHWFEIFGNIALTGEPAHFESEAKTLGRHYDVSAYRVGGAESRRVAILFNDITERKRAEVRIAYLNRVYAVLSGINTLIVRTRDRDELFKAACRIAVEVGDFHMTWIGVADRNAMKVIPVASAGVDEKLLTAIRDKLSLSEDAPFGNNMPARVIREKKSIVSNDSQNDPQVLFRKQYAESGVNSIATLPLIVADEAIGVFTLCANEAEFFHAEELKLLTELAGDISFALEHIGKEEKLRYLAYHDPLTGLGNRSLLYDRLEQAIRSARQSNIKVALMFGDIKGFRQINETLGREAGDEVLRELARRLQQLTPEPENVARMSADYFAGIISNFTEISELAHLMEQAINGLLSNPYTIDNKRFRISSRVGIAVFPLDGDDADALFRNAEAALQKAKITRGRYLFYQPEMNSKVAETLLLEHKLRTAIEKEEFILYYQPKINTASGKISGFEALIRWNDPDNGLVPPLKFIPLLEESGMILEVGAWAIRRALADHRDWKNQGLQPPRIAVNVSAIQLRQKDFVKMVRDLIGKSEEARNALDLEITESLIMENIEDSIQKLKALRDMGINIAIDDFGTGYSSLGYLTRLPVDTLKIDHSFVIKMTSDPDSMAIVSTIITLAHSLNLKVVAEGVETEDHSRFLKLLKCDELQGYLFSKPLPPAEISKLLKAS